ncbi:MAG: sigma-70 family RNA polymerase sigma factor [Planctomycetota bacterium]
MTNTRTTTLDDLLAHRRWLRALVRELVGEHQVDDVVQETWLAALRRPPSHPAATKSWLRRVAHNFAAKSHRTERRWRRRQMLGAKPEALPGTDELFAELQAQRRVAAAVAELEEPYREVVLWRYLDGRSIRDIGARLNLPESTVRTRLSRGLARVRSRLEQRHGAEWRALALWPLLQPAAAIGTGALVVATKTKTATAVAAVLLGAVGAVWSVSWLATSPERAPAPSAPTDTAQLQAPTPGTTVVRTSVADTATPPASDPSSAPTVQVHGQVLDDRGAPVGRVPLRLVPATSWGPRPTFRRPEPRGPAIAHSTADGAFALPLPDAPSDVVTGGDFVTLRAAPIDPAEPDAPRTLVVATRVTIDGRVVDEQGRGVADATISASAEPLGAFEGDLEPTVQLAMVKVGTNQLGQFEHDRVPGTRQAALHVVAPGYEPARFPSAAHDQRDVVIALRRIAADGSALLVRVVDQIGRPVPGAVVTFGSEREVAGDDGQAHLAWRRRGWLQACAEGHQPLLIDDFSQETWREQGAPVPLTLTLGGPALAITGQVVDAGGHPVAGLGVAIAQAIMLLGEKRPAEQLAAGGGPHCLEWIETDANGNFTLGGLADREYALRFFDRASRLSVTTEPIPAGARDVVVRVPDQAVRRPFRGVVQAPDGTPLPGLAVRILNQICQTPEAQLKSEWHDVDEHGRFELPVAPRFEGLLQIRGDAVPPTSLHLSRYATQEPAIVVAERRCRIRFLEAAPGTDADIVIPIDDQDRDVQMLALQRGSPRPFGWWAIADGRSPELVLPERATQLAYYKSGKRTKVVPLTLIPGQLVEIRP